MGNEKTKSCFIIGPMGDAGQGSKARLRVLANEIVKPLLERHGFQVKTPYDLRNGKIMKNVIREIDRAALVVADITGNNPNVFYELSICHALGIPTVTVKEKNDPTLVAFDLSDFIYTTITIDNILESKEELRQTFDEVLPGIGQRVLFENPITGYYHEPLTNISPAAGLAQGYYQNFVKPTIDRLKWLNPDQTEYLYDIKINEGNDSRQQIFEIGKMLDAREGMHLHIIVPERLDFCTEDRVGQVKRNIKQAVIQTERRSFTTLARLHQQVYQLVDIPTTMNVMIASVNRRAAQLHINVDSEEWMSLEYDEIERFYFELSQWTFDRNNGHEFTRRVKIHRYNPDRITDELLWLRNIWTS